MFLIQLLQPLPTILLTRLRPIVRFRKKLVVYVIVKQSRDLHVPSAPA